MLIENKYLCSEHMLAFLFNLTMICQNVLNEFLNYDKKKSVQNVTVTLTFDHSGNMCQI